TKAVGSVQLDAEPNNFVSSHQLTLTGSDAANNVVDTDTVTAAAGIHLNALAVSDGNTIKHFTIAADAGSQGIFFSNIVWTCTRPGRREVDPGRVLVMPPRPASRGRAV